MKSIKATLEILGKTYDVLSYENKFSYKTDKIGRISSPIQGGRIAIKLKYTYDNAIPETMLKSELLCVDGKISLMDAKDNVVKREIEFNNAYIVHYKEVFDKHDEILLVTLVTLSAQIISIRGIKFDKCWG
ncbi:MAG: type VI secretion system needle protein Hcp [Candidatus Phocaeicola faecipullorum]|nr:type VI secretion system needle protein Hcp [Candidatus Phocaeicola faecipullorum]